MNPKETKLLKKQQNITEHIFEAINQKPIVTVSDTSQHRLSSTSSTTLLGLWCSLLLRSLGSLGSLRSLGHRNLRNLRLMAPLPGCSRAPLSLRRLRAISQCKYQHAQLAENLFSFIEIQKTCEGVQRLF